MTNFMIDLETLGNKPGSIILTCACIPFNPRGDSVPLDDSNDLSFYKRIDRISCQDLGLKADASTRQWWKEQSEEARQEAFNATPRIPIKQVLNELRSFILDIGGDRSFIWSHGAGFDIVLLESAFRLANIPPPWKFWNARCTRTIYHLSGVTRTTPEVPHHALYDAIAQARDVQTSYKMLAR